MSRDPYPSESAERFQIRMPNGLRDEIRSAAAANERSMNAEIVARLSGGTSTRDEAAMHFLAGFCANQAIFAPNAASGWSLCNCTEEQLAELAFRLADVFVAQRERG